MFRLASTRAPQLAAYRVRLLMLLVALALAACSNVGDETPTAVSDPTQPQTDDPATAVPDNPTPMPKAEFMGVEFVFSRDALGSVPVSARGVPLPPTTQAPVGYPEHIRFQFETSDPESAFSPLAAQVLVFPTDQYASMSLTAAEQMQALETLLAERPYDVGGDLPMLPMLDGIQTFHTRPVYLDFENGVGVRYIAQHEAELSLIDNDAIFYTFQGLTEDGRFYVAAFFPVDASGLLEELDMNDTAVLDNQDAWTAYRDATAHALSELSSDSFAPDLYELDRAMSSLRVVPSPGFPTSLPPRLAMHEGVMVGYGDELATTVTAEKIPAQLPDPDGVLTFLPGVPDFIQFTFERDGDGEKRPSTLVIQPVRDASGAFYDAIPNWHRAHLEDLQARISGTTPLHISRGVQALSLDFFNGSGVRGVTSRGGSEPQMVTNETLAYRFEGLTGDGRYFVQFDYGVASDLLPSNGEFSGDEASDVRASYDQYVLDTLQPLGALPNSAFTPNLGTLDSMMRSLAIAAQASTASSVPANAPDCTNDAAFVTDINIPDESVIEPGETFTKTWRLRNTGTCSWMPDYSLAYVEGDGLDWIDSAAPGVVRPGREADVSVTLVAPQTQDTYRAYWQLQGPDGAPFGERFYVDFRVPAPVRTLDGYGVIEGEITYPAGGTPAMIIYFQRVDGPKRYALETDDGWNHYINEIPAGEYVVFARVIGDESGSGGGYTYAVQCGLTAQCTDHELVPVQVQAGKRTRGIDVADWYAPAGTFPAP